MHTSKAPRGALLTGATALATLAIVTLGMGGAQAATFTLDTSGSFSHTLSNFDVTGLPGGVGNGTSITAWSSGCTNCGLQINPGNVSVTFTFLGKEASDTNTATTFVNNGITLFNNNTAVGTSVTETYSLGTGTNYLPFGFTDTNNGGNSATFVATNNGNTDYLSIGSNVAIGFKIIDSSTVLAFFDDNNPTCDQWGHCTSNADHDYDDMVVEISFNQGIPGQTPLPAALPLFASGAGVLGLLGWRRKKKVQA